MTTLPPEAGHRPTLLELFRRYALEGPRVGVWLGETASREAGFPSPGEVREACAAALHSATDDPVGTYHRTFGAAGLRAFFDAKFSRPRGPAPVHLALAELAQAGALGRIYTASPDSLLEQALAAAHVDFSERTSELSGAATEQDDVVVVRLGGSESDWREVVVSLADDHVRRQVAETARHELGRAIGRQPLLYVALSIDDFAVFDGLVSLPPERKEAAFEGYILTTHDLWSAVPALRRLALQASRIHVLLVTDGHTVGTLLHSVARRLAPIADEPIEIEIHPGPAEWILTGPQPEAPERTVPNPLLDALLLDRIGRFRSEAARPVTSYRAVVSTGLQAAAHAIGEDLTRILLSDGGREYVARRLNEPARPTLVLRVRARTPLADQALALPWELLMPEPGEFAVREHRLNLVREAYAAGASHLPKPTDPLRVVVAIAAPDDRPQLRHEQESSRLYTALCDQGHEVVFAGLGTRDELVRVIRRLLQESGTAPDVIHFSGHGAPGALVFEDPLGLSDPLPASELYSTLRLLLDRAFPRLLFLASCHGADPVPGTLPSDSALPVAASAAACLHRYGFAQVVGYFGPVSDPLSTRAETTFYQRLAAGDTTAQAVAMARASLDDPLDAEDGRVRYPFAWTQLVLFHRGPNEPLAVPTPAPASPRVPPAHFDLVARRRLQHRMRRLLGRERESRLAVIHGPPGAGKSTLARHVLLGRYGTRHVLELRACPAAGDADWLHGFFAGIDRHAETHLPPGPDWLFHRAELEREADPCARFELAVGLLATLLRATTPAGMVPETLVLFVDDAHHLQRGPVGAGVEPGEPRPEAAAVWAALLRLAEGRVVVLTTRHLWRALGRDAWMSVGEMSLSEMQRGLDLGPSRGDLSPGTRARLAEGLGGLPESVRRLRRLLRQRLEGPFASESRVWSVFHAPLLRDVDREMQEHMGLQATWDALDVRTRAHARALAAQELPIPAELVVSFAEPMRELLFHGWLARQGDLPLSVDGGTDRATLSRFTPEPKDPSGLWGLPKIIGDFVSRVGESPSAPIATPPGADPPAASHPVREELAQKLREWVEAQPLTPALVPQARASVKEAVALGAGTQVFRLAEKVIDYLSERGLVAQTRGFLEIVRAADLSPEQQARLVFHHSRFEQEQGGVLPSTASPTPAGTRSPAVRLHLEAIDRATRRDFTGAEASLRELVALVRQDPTASPLSPAALFSELGRVVYKQHRPEEALGLLTEALSRRRAEVDTTPESLANTHYLLAKALSRVGRLAEAEAHARDAYRILGEVEAQGGPLFTRVVSRLAWILRHGRKTNEAEILLRQLVSHAEARCPDRPVIRGAALHELGTFLHRTNHLPEAAQVLRQAVEAKTLALGPDHLGVGRSWFELGRVLYNGGEVAGAEHAVSEACRIFRAEAGPDDPSIAAALGLAAAVLDDLCHSRADAPHVPDGTKRHRLEPWESIGWRLPSPAPTVPPPSSDERPEVTARPSGASSRPESEPPD